MPRMIDPSRIEQLRRRVDLNPASIAFAVLAEEYRRAGRHEEAIATCRAGLRRHPAYLSPRVTLGRALLALGRDDEARAELEGVVHAAPDNIAALRALESIRMRSGALPALEAFLAAIRRAGAQAESTRPSVPRSL